MERQNISKSEKITIIAVVVSILLVMLIIITAPIVYDGICRNRVYDDMAAKIDDDILSSNVCVIGKTITENENTESTSYNTGSSGVIVDRKGDIYYVLTAYHVVYEETEEETINPYSNTISEKSFCIVPFGSLTYDEYWHENGKYIPMGDYYDRFPMATVEYVNEIYDLAVISFKSDEDYCVAEISDIMPEFGDRIVTIGNPEGERFARAYGKITSKKPALFGFDDGLPSNLAWKHNAYIAPGSSGSIAMNESMEVVGINIGGGTDGLGRFRYGVMIACDQISEFLAEWEEIG